MAVTRGSKRVSRPTADEAAAAGTPEAARAVQLQRILGSALFQQADRLKNFLTFVVTETLAGRQDALKEYVIGVQVFHKEESFDPRTDPIVRVQARRLRAKLVRYYHEEGHADALIIDLPKGGYVPVFRSREAVGGAEGTPGPQWGRVDTVVVGRVADLTPGGELTAFVEGLRDELIHAVARLPGLRVRASASTPADAADTPSTVTVGGSVRLTGDRLRVTMHLIDGATDSYLWSEAIDGDRREVVGVQEHVAQLVAGRLESTRREPWHAPGAPAVNLAAQNLYVQGRYHLNQRTEEGLRKAVDFFERALAEVAGFGRAHSGLADAYSLLAHYGVMGPGDAWAKAADYAATSVELDDRSAEAHTSLAHVRATQRFDWSGAEHEFQRAIALDPTYATAHHWYASSCLVPTGRLAEALGEIRTAQLLDPVSSIVARDLALIHFYRRDFETALEACDHAVELNPHFAPAYWTLGIIQEQRRDFDESLAAFERGMILSPIWPRMHSGLGRALALSGKKRQAREQLRKLEEVAGHRYVSPVEFAWIHLALGEVDAGFRWLAKASDDRSFDLMFLNVDPRYDAYRDDPRFRVLVAQMALPGQIQEPSNTVRQ